ncbi:MAG: LapA family protein [Chromatiales bacterium]|jgi:uncharacterized integral membrane protein|nr:LapA family protein [Chromatiales bacterium]MDX9765713.1 LapA family protein [Ectothiorhodospiraceae bacterium]
MRKFFYLLVLLVAVAIGVSFTVLNAGTVDVNIYFRSFSVPVALVVFLSVFVGAVLGVVACTGMIWARHRELRSLRRRARLAEEELDKLRKIPIKDTV